MLSWQKAFCWKKFRGTCLFENPLPGIINQHLVQKVKSHAVDALLHHLFQIVLGPHGKSGLKHGKNILNVESSYVVVRNSTLKSGKAVTPGQIFSVGVRSTRKILNSWSISESPWKIDKGSNRQYIQLIPFNLEEGLPVQHLGEDCAQRPHVQGAGVLGTAKQDLGRPGDQGHDEVFNTS